MVALHETLCQIATSIYDGPSSELIALGQQFVDSFDNSSATAVISLLNPWFLYIACDPILIAAMEALPPAAVQFAVDLLLWVGDFIKEIGLINLTL